MSLLGSRAGRAGLAARARRRLRDERGISLVEALVAIVLVGIVLTALTNSTITSLVAMRDNERRTHANALANGVVEQLRGIAWEDAGFYDDDYAGTPPPHVSLGATRPASEEPAAGEACESNVPPLPSCDDVIRDGVAYDLDTSITWVDDAADGTTYTGADPDRDGDIRDYKHVTATVEWSDQGTQSVTVEAYRAASADEQPPNAFSLTLDSVTPTRAALNDEPAASNAVPVTFEASTATPAASVRLSWIRRDGTTANVFMTATDADNLQWAHTIATGSEAFANGETLFTLAATNSAGTVKTRQGRVLFLHALAVRTPTLSHASGAAPIRVKASNSRPCSDLTLRVQVQGALTSDLVTATWSGGPGTQPLLPVGSTPAGALFERVYTTTGSTFNPPSGTATVTIQATRSTDAATATLTQSHGVTTAC